MTPHENIIDEPDSVQTQPSIAGRYSNSWTKIFATWTDSRNISAGNGDTDIYYAESGSPFGTNIIDTEFIFTNQHLANYAEELLARLINQKR